MVTVKQKKSKTRKAPSVSATSVPEGTVMNSWVVKKTVSRIPRWVPIQNAVLHHFRLLTLAVFRKHINQPITVFCRDYANTWPLHAASFDYSFTCTPNGDATVKNKVIRGWLNHKQNVNCRYVHTDGEFEKLQVHHGLVTTNALSKECFVRDG
jgi:hypothetical protein